jgi:hypothetical protein
VRVSALEDRDGADVPARPFDAERAREILQTGAGGLVVGVFGRRGEEHDQRRLVRADRVPGLVEGLAPALCGAVDEDVGALARPSSWSRARISRGAPLV